MQLHKTYTNHAYGQIKDYPISKNLVYLLFREASNIIYC